ncbi:glycosyltransferase BC10 isoform X2 [Arachis duranensis]|uniref:Glycosyltransferase BC10 isoform X2 n=1 Tax=Arachis duranensis TaxID=130453 RepID=A0A9C6WNR2_ARADU|nr:glycosyltransferase BC10 isoform X2 [Arachis duranensis]
MVVVATASARGVPPKRRHVITSTSGSRFFSWKLLILLCVSLSCLVVLASLFSLHSSYLSNADSSNHFKVTRSTVSRTFHGPPKIAFLFLVRQNIPLDFLWHVFFKNGNVAKFSIYVHSAPGFVLDESTTRSSFFYGTQISNVIQVSWGESSMIQAERLLLAAALDDPANQRFVLLSDSCVPLYNFSYVYNYVMVSQRSFVDSFLDVKDGRYNPKMSPKIPREKWRKGSQLNF